MPITLNDFIINFFVVFLVATHAIRGHSYPLPMEHVVLTTLITSKHK